MNPIRAFRVTGPRTNNSINGYKSVPRESSGGVSLIGNGSNTTTAALGKTKSNFSLSVQYGQNGPSRSSSKGPGESPDKKFKGVENLYDPSNGNVNRKIVLKPAGTPTSSNFYANGQSGSNKMGLTRGNMSTKSYSGGISSTKNNFYPSMTMTSGGSNPGSDVDTPTASLPQRVSRAQRLTITDEQAVKAIMNAASGGISKSAVYDNSPHANPKTPGLGNTRSVMKSNTVAPVVNAHSRSKTDDVKLPRIESENIVRREKESELDSISSPFNQLNGNGTAVNNININLSINNLNIIQTKSAPQSDDQSSPVTKVTRTPSNNAIKPVKAFGGSDSLKSPSDSNILMKSNISSKADDMSSTRRKGKKGGDEDEKIVEMYSYKSRAGAMPGGVTKTNQDAFIMNTNFMGDKNRYFFAVCDGHGMHGHNVSAFVKQHLPKNIETHHKAKGDEPSALKSALTSAFLLTNQELLRSHIDCTFSGTTTVSVLLMGSKIYTANVGDSRAVIGKCSNNRWSAYEISHDHKPDTPSEMARIVTNGGRVEPFKDQNGEPIGPARVWLKNDNVPGLAMARSMGDVVASQAGVICEPEILEFEVGDDDRFMIIASDGVWEFISNQEAVDYVLPFYEKRNPEGACDKLVKESVICWKREDEVIDDITAIVIFFNTGSKGKH